MDFLDSKIDLDLDATKMTEDIVGVIDGPTKRLAIDMASSNWLAQMVRPGLAFWAAAMYTFLSITSLIIAKGTDDFALVVASVFASISGILITIIGFYFKGRKQEKIDMKKMQTTLEIKKMEVESKIELEEMKLDSDLDDEKLERTIKNRNSRREGRFRLFKNDGKKD